MKLPFAILLAVAGTAVTATAVEAQPRRDYNQSRDYRADGRHDDRGNRRAHARRDRQDRWVVGRFYNGRGYWNGQRWYQHRYRHNGGWRYR